MCSFVSMVTSPPISFQAGSEPLPLALSNDMKEYTCIQAYLVSRVVSAFFLYVAVVIHFIFSFSLGRH